jgi:hypothetical protein
MLIGNKSDVEKYKDPRFRVANLIGQKFIDTLDSQLSPSQKNEFIEYPFLLHSLPLPIHYNYSLSCSAYVKKKEKKRKEKKLTKRQIYG